MQKTILLIILLSFQLNVSAQFSATLHFGDVTCGWDSVLGEYYEVDIILDNRFVVPCGGIQFDISGANIDSAGGGVADSAGWAVSHSASTFLGFSFSLVTLPSDSAVLTILRLINPTDTTTPCITNIVYSDVNAIQVPAFAGPCLFIHDQDIQICGGDSVLLGGMYQFISGVYDDSLMTNNGCDSIIRTDLFVDTVSGYIMANSADICNGDSILFQNNYYSSTGTYYDSLQTQLCGKDSIYIFNLTVYNNTSSSFSKIVCGSYTSPSGQTWTTSGMYYDTISNASGCDSSITINLTVNQTSSSSINETACDTYTSIGGQTWTASGTYYDFFTNSLGCDSTVIINLTVNQSFSNSESASICNGDSILLQGVYQTVSGTYFDSLTAANGCDSIITTALIVNSSFSTSQSASICNGDSILLQGVYQTVSGTYFDSLTAANGCDSIITTALTVNSSFSTSEFASICYGDSILLQGGYQTTAGTYFDTLTAANGCDSIIVSELIVNTLPIPVITQNGSTLTSSSATSYQWYQGNSMLISENAQSYSAIVSGSYSVIVTDSNGCMGSSDTLVFTILSVDERNAKSHILVIPNPFNEQASIKFNNLSSNGPYTIIVHNLIGKKVFERTTMESQVLFKRNELIQGIYFIELIENSNRLVEKLIIK